jgi:hypothetical protein
VALPPKQFRLPGMAFSTSPELIEERRLLLEVYLQRLLSTSELAQSQPFLQFLATDKISDIDAGVAPDQLVEVVELPVDVEVTELSIPRTRTMSDHVLFQIDCVNDRKRTSLSKWTVLKRFGQFYEMDSELRGSFAEQPEVAAALPSAPKRESKLLVDHMSPTFVEQRRLLLEQYLKKMMTCIPVLQSPIFLKFIGVSE